ncbi:MATE family efflux transporter [Bacillus marasmi]|uniref:MATE family efflux transporter n=1 Tax=Bacillus marasmi TaxID=1926279 RepID=UPI0011C9125F|nr:MATE family efflux transporter [Bacillus marasmi]
MYQTYTLQDKLKQLTYLLIPILITQLGMYTMVFFNIIMTGQYDSTELAGVAIGSSIWNPIFTGLGGILLAVSPIAAQRFGENKKQGVSSITAHGIYLSIGLGLIIIFLGYLYLDAVLEMMKVDHHVRQTAKEFLLGLSYGIIPLFLFNVLRSFIYALGKTRVVMVVLLFSLPINFLFNYLLIFGNGGFPELGGAGAGYATSITYWLLTSMMILITLRQKPFKGYRVLESLTKFSVSELIEVLKIGVPMGLALFFESAIFAVVTILISKFDMMTVAAYQAAINVMVFIYMIPLSISMAQTVLIGYEIGSGRLRDAKAYAWIGIYLSLIIAFVGGLAVIFFRYEIAGLYLHNPKVIEIMVGFLSFALFFMVADALQAAALGALRGYQDVIISFLMTLIGYWLICLPLGYFLAQSTKLGAIGYWLGLTVGLFAVGIVLVVRLHIIQKKQQRSSGKTEPILAVQ